jgi:hypothetical protein
VSAPSVTQKKRKSSEWVAEEIQRLIKKLKCKSSEWVAEEIQRLIKKLK